MSLLEITQLSHSFGDQVLFKDASLTLNKGEHIGIVGQNGAGKSTLIKICMEQIIPDAGRAVWQPGVTAGCLDQHAQAGTDATVMDFLKSAFRSLYLAEEEMNRLYAQAAGGSADALKLAAQYQEQLEQNAFYSIDTHIQQVAAGLGLQSIVLDRPLRELSGGQRAKAILAKLLLEKPDVLLLDEPTNFLDKEHISWLADCLSGLESAFLLISHDREFLEKTANRICDIDNGKITKYSGNYSQFLKKKTLLRGDYLRQYAAQQKEIRKTEEFIRRNIAGRKSKMAKGRQKQLDRMDKLETLSQKEILPVFRFACLPVTAAIHLEVQHLSVGYGYPILPELDFSIRGGQKIVVTGFNGIGKSTLLKTLARRIPALHGSFSFSEQVRLGYFEQELMWEDPTRTPLQIMMEAYPALPVKEARRRLSGCGISSGNAMQAIGTLSGGEQAKVKMCLLTAAPHNFLMLDEPTNHLDRQAKEALQTALSGFSGTVLLVSHEEAFYRGWAQRVISIEKAVKRG